MQERTDAVNWSTLKHILTSPKHYRHAIEHPREDTDALRLGRLVHAMVYEPDEADARYDTMPNFHGGMRDETAREKGYEGGKQAKAAWLEANQGKEIVSAEEWELARNIRDAVYADPVAAEHMAHGRSEFDIEWEDPETGILCRGRVDHVNGRLSDLKTTRALGRFEDQIARYMYHGQLAWYSWGLEQSNVAVDGPPCIIAVENTAPFDVGVFDLDGCAGDAGRSLFREALDILAECRRTDSWPGRYPGRVSTVLPVWGIPQPERVALTMGGEPLSF